jgi:DNA replication protein DnaC
MSDTPADPKSQLIDNLKELHLPAMRNGFEEVALRAQRESQSYERYLLELTERECQARQANRIERLLKDSRPPLAKTLESLDLKRLPVKVVRQVRALLDGTFADRRENVLAFGNPGSGKTHVLSAISHTLIRSGRRVYFGNRGLMVRDLPAAKRDLKLSGLFKKLSRYEVLVLDDLGYVQPLPPYSPDFNPIEEMFSKFKEGLRRLGARAKNHLYDAIAEALREVTLLDILGWFRQAGSCVMQA